MVIIVLGDTHCLELIRIEYELLYQGVRGLFSFHYFSLAWRPIGTESKGVTLISLVYSRLICFYLASSCHVQFTKTKSAFHKQVCTYNVSQT